MDAAKVNERTDTAAPPSVPCGEAKEIAHVGFEIGLVFKALHGLVQLLGGFIMLYVTPDRLSALADFLTRYRLSCNPQAIFAGFFVKLCASFSVGTQRFVLFYLFSHGLVRVALVYLLWRKKLFAYPLSMGCLVFFIVCQLYRYTLTGSFMLLLFTLLDSGMVILTYLEYKNLRPAGT
ncbi:hypothetical protein SDC9_112547 [bioreactor metagenome]|uniref:DUF2127 domain-containing protein n=1 Tax=bioreactor metagenome TaxID=1076179 RepID=A0A645BJL2_9ZZZZ